MTDIKKDLHITRKTFAEQAGMKDLTEISHLTEADLIELNTLFPIASAQLIIELAGAWRLAETKLRTLRRSMETTQSNSETVVM